VQTGGAKTWTSRDGLDNRGTTTAAGQEFRRTNTARKHNIGDAKDSNLIQDVREAEAKG